MDHTLCEREETPDLTRVAPTATAIPGARDVVPSGESRSRGDNDSVARRERRPDPWTVLRLQRLVGNAAVAQMLNPPADARAHAVSREINKSGPTKALTVTVQRDDGDDGQSQMSSYSDLPDAAQSLVGSEIPIAVSTPDPLDVPAYSSDSGSPVQSLRVDRLLSGGTSSSGRVSVQRDDVTPHPGGDLSLTSPIPPGLPLTLQGTLVARSEDFIKLQSGAWEWDFGHEPNISLIGDTSGTLAVQEAITLINAHWFKERWHDEIELGLSAWMQATLYPALGITAGGQAQAEFHITPTFSSTMALNLIYTPPPAAGSSGSLSLQPGFGFLWHFAGP